jgi:hypothetical protein
MNNHGNKRKKLYKEKVYENKILIYTTRSTKLNLSIEFLLYSFLSYSLYHNLLSTTIYHTLPTKGMARVFIEESHGKK